MTDAKTTAEAATKFLKTPFGKQFVQALNLHYNGLHQEAEDKSLSVEQKAMLVERAAGVKVAINYLLQREQLVKGEYFKK